MYFCTCVGCVFGLAPFHNTLSQIFCGLAEYVCRPFAVYLQECASYRESDQTWSRGVVFRQPPIFQNPQLLHPSSLFHTQVSLPEYTPSHSCSRCKCVVCECACVCTACLWPLLTMFWVHAIFAVYLSHMSVLLLFNIPFSLLPLLSSSIEFQ